MATPPGKMTTIVQFTPFSSLVQPSFWHELTRVKVDVLRLADDALPIRASYAVGRSVRDRETGNEIDLGCHLTISGDSFKQDSTEKSTTLGTVECVGTFKNYNTIEEFKAADKTALFNQVADEIWDGIIKTGDIVQLNRFLLITFADLKKYKYYYWFTFPAFVAKPAWTIGEAGWQAAEQVLGHNALSAIHTKLYASNSTLPYFLARVPSLASSSASTPTTKNEIEIEIEIAPISEYETFFAQVPAEEQLVGFVDPSADPQHPGWPLRNALAYLRARFLLRGQRSAKLRVLCWRDVDYSPRAGSGNGREWKSRFGVVESEGDEATELAAAAAAAAGRPTAVGWEKNPQGKLGPRLADLAPMMDPSRLADQAVDLNLKLMRWRILPALDLEKIAATRCLLLGAGTLGCYVARALLAWGIRTITFVDSATVSFSNPVRQPLFEFADCLEGGKPKAQCAADALKKIFPGANARGVSLMIPMPGHPVPQQVVDNVKKDVATLETLIEEHDTIFLLMDSRESRWLPTVIGKAKQKIVMNAALGFDSYLVMRHGARGSLLGEDGSRETSSLGCYYCNDVVAPADSLTDRTLDQMCTVTRPGLAAIASATAVELLVSILQHPKRDSAPAPPPELKVEDADDESSPYRSVLGVVPHQLRGFLAQFRTLPIVGAAFDQCTGCSEAVLQAYETEGFAVLLRAFNEPRYLEKLTGLDKLQSEGDAVLESIDWDEEAEGDE